MDEPLHFPNGKTSFFYLGNHEDLTEREYEITGYQFLEGAVFFVPVVDLTDPQSEE